MISHRNIKITYDISKTKNISIVSHSVEKKYNISISTNNNFGAKNTFLKHFIKSGIFSKISYNYFSPIGKSKQIFFISINEINCLINHGDNTWINNNIFNECDKINKHIDFYFVLQYSHNRKEEYNELGKKYSMFVLPLIYPPSPNFKENTFLWKNKEFKYLANMAFGTRIRKHRRPWIKRTLNDNRFFRQKTFGDDYINILKDTKWGLSLKGAGYSFDGKCYREAEYMSFGMPLALNYKPCYPFPFYPGEHYLYLNNPIQLAVLDSIDPTNYAKKSRETWENYFSPKGMTNLLLEIIFNKKYRDNIPKFWKHFEEKSQDNICKTNI